MLHRGWRSRGYIPHCGGADLVQHIVFSTVGRGEGIASHFGKRFMAKPEAAEVVQNAILHFDAERYRIFAWCVMPNHVHVVVQQIDGWPLEGVLHSWKSFTARAINRIHERGGAVWMREYFDRYMRDEEHFARTLSYVERNPVSAGYVKQPAEWCWSSARYRERQSP